MLLFFTTKLSQQNLPKLAINGIFTVDKRFSDRFPLNFSQKFELDCCWFYPQSEHLNRKMTDQNSDENTIFFTRVFVSFLYRFFRFKKKIIRVIHF